MAVILFAQSRFRRPTFLFILFCLTVCVWGIGGYKFSTTIDKAEAFFWWRFAYICAICSPVFFSNYVFEFLDVNKKILFKFIYGTTFLFLLVNFFASRYFLGDLRLTFNQFYTVDWLKYKNPLFLIFYISYWWLLLGYALFELVKHYIKSTGIKKNQLKYFIVASVIGWLGAHGQFVVYFHIDVYPVSNFALAIYPLIITYAIIRYRLMDMKIIIQKGLVYSVLVTIITALYLIFVLSIGRIFQNLVGYQSFIINLIAVFTIAVAFNPMREWVQRILDKRFFQGTLESLAQEKQKLQQELFHKEKLAYIGQLASQVVHEIKNPLTTLKTFWEYYPKKQEDPDFKNKFEHLIPQELNRIDNVVSQLLDLAKSKLITKTSVNIIEVLEVTLALLDENLKINNIEIKRKYSKEEIYVEGDKEQLKQVFLNLLLNSIDAMAVGGSVCVDVSAGIEDSNVKIIITDTGCGMSQETLERLFEPFMTTKKNGIGLGMSITKEIIKEHGGSIEVESEIGNGAKFIIKFKEKT